MADELKPIRIVISADSQEAQQALEKAETSVGKFSRGIKSFAQAAQGGEEYSEQLKNSIKGLTEKAQAAADKVDQLSAEYDEMAKSGSASDEQLAKLAQRLVSAKNQLERYASKLADARAEQLALDNGAGELYRQLQENATATQAAAERLTQMGDAAGAASTRAEGLAAKSQTLTSLPSALQSAAKQAASALGEDSTEANRLRAAYDSASTAAGKTTTAIEKNTDSLEDSTDAVEDNTLKWEALADTLTSKVTRPLLELGKSALSAAADAEAMESSFDSVFGRQAESARNWSKHLADDLNASETKIRESMLSWQTLFNGMEVSGNRSAEMVQNLTERAYDMAALFDTDVTTVMEKMQSAMVGNHQTMRSFGVVITENTLKEAAYSKGIAKRGETLTEQQKILTRYQLIMEQTAQAEGRWNDEADDTSGKLRTLSEIQEEVTRKLGEALLPLLDKLLDVVMPIAEFLGNMSSTGWGVVAVIGGIVAALGPILKIVTLLQNLKLASGIKAVSSAFSGLQSFMSGPLFSTLGKILLIVAAVAAAIALVAAAIALANGNMARWQEAMNASNGVSSTVNSTVSQVKKVGANARGTSYWRGGLTYVGEEGPELVELPQGSKVYSSGESARRALGGDTYVFNVDFDKVQDVQKFMDTARAARRLGRQGVKSSYV